MLLVAGALEPLCLIGLAVSCGDLSTLCCNRQSIYVDIVLLAARLAPYLQETSTNIKLVDIAAVTLGGGGTRACRQNRHYHSSDYCRVKGYAAETTFIVVQFCSSYLNWLKPKGIFVTSHGVFATALLGHTTVCNWEMHMISHLPRPLFSSPPGT